MTSNSPYNVPTPQSSHPFLLRQQLRVCYLSVDLGIGTHRQGLLEILKYLNDPQAGVTFAISEPMARLSVSGLPVETTQGQLGITREERISGHL